MVLFPFGQPEARTHRSRCTDFAIRCGGDLSRIIDAPNDTIEQFGAYLWRIRGLREGAEHALVVVARGKPLALIASDARRQLESWVPALRQAVWMMYLDPEDEPHFLSTAERFGRLSGPLDTAPIWVGPGLTRFIVASPLVTNLHRVADRITEIDRDRRADAWLA